jgi:DNA polymerase-3 subunit gamma/tau
MAYEITATRKRPQTFEELAGQDFVSATLRASIAHGRIAHAYLFAGPRGCGKTSTARILARSLNCELGPSAEPCGTCDSCLSIARGAALDVIEIDGASNTSVENIRQIKDEVLFPPNVSKYKIYIIDEVHMLSNSAFNALLKTIEEPPPYIIFIFATTELHKVPATIKSRCQQFNFRLIPQDTIIERLASACDDLGIRADADALLWIAREATGSLRDAYTLFDQVAAFSEDHITAARIQDKLGLAGTEQLGMLLELCVTGNRAGALELLDTIITGGVSLEQFTTDIVSYVRSLLLIVCGIQRESLLGMPRSAFPDALMQHLDAARLERMLASLLDLYRDMRYSVNPRFELELAVSRLSAIKHYIPLPELSRTIKALKASITGGNAAGAVAIGAGFRAAMPAAAAQATNQAASTTIAGPAATAPVFMPDKGSTETADQDSLHNGTGDQDPVGIDPQALRVSILQSLGKNRVVLSTCLERSSQWQINGGKLVISCQNGYDASTIAADANMIARKVMDTTGMALRVEAVAIEPSREAVTVPHDDDEDDDSDAAMPADPVEIVEQVFRGRRIASRTTAQPDARQAMPAD